MSRDFVTVPAPSSTFSEFHENPRPFGAPVALFVFGVIWNERVVFVAPFASTVFLDSYEMTLPEPSRIENPGDGVAPGAAAGADASVVGATSVRAAKIRTR